MIEFGWFPGAIEFCETYGIPREFVEAAAREPTTTSLDPSTAERGYTVEARRRGDVTAVVGLQNPEHPMILYARVHTGADATTGSTRSPGSTQIADRPRTLRGLKARVVADGFRIVMAGTGHERIEDQEGNFVATIVSTSGDRNYLTVTWLAYTKARDRWRAQQRAKDAG